MTEQGHGNVEEGNPNASLSPASETRRASRWLGSLSLAFFLGIEPLDRPSPAFHVRWLRGGGDSSILAESEETAARERILAAIERASVEDLEDGMTYDLGMCVASVVRQYHELAMTTLAESIHSGELSPETASHTLRWLGRMKDPATESSRMRLLSRGLKAASPIVRDGAALGLAALGEREAIPMLEKAVHEEQVVALRRDLEQVLRELEQLP